MTNGGLVFRKTLLIRYAHIGESKKPTADIRIIGLIFSEISRKVEKFKSMKCGKRTIINAGIMNPFR